MRRGHPLRCRPNFFQLCCHRLHPGARQATRTHSTCRNTLRCPGGLLQIKSGLSAHSSLLPAGRTHGHCGGGQSCVRTLGMLCVFRGKLNGDAKLQPCPRPPRRRRSRNRLSPRRARRSAGPLHSVLASLNTWQRWKDKPAGRCPPKRRLRRWKHCAPPCPPRRPIQRKSSICWRDLAHRLAVASARRALLRLCHRRMSTGRAWPRPGL